MDGWTNEQSRQTDVQAAGRQTPSTSRKDVLVFRRDTFYNISLEET